MKTFRLLLLALLVVSTASAQRHHHRKGKGYEPTVYFISVQETDTIYKCSPCQIQQRMARNNAAMQQAIADYNETHRPGFQHAEKPQFIFSTKNNKFSFAIGGYVNLRAAYSFDGITNNIDFVPYDIPVPGNYATRQRLQMDASTSRVYLKGIANTRALGRVVIFIDADFRGGRENSYTPRLRSAYVSFKGLTLGRDVSTFCDLTAAPETVDFQGPNAYNYNFATMIRYEYSFCRDHFTMGMAAEMPNVSATYGTDQLAAIPQRVPDFPVYFQYAWGKNRQNHFRASAVFRDMYYYNLTSEKVSTHFGWGVQASGNMAVGKALNIYFNGVYGEGITPYILDLTGSGLDFTPNPLNPSYSQVTPMYGWQAAARINLLKNLFISGGYSMVKVLKKNTFYSTDEYREGQYIFGNIFYNITPRFKIAAEYLYGTRRNMDGARNHANRLNLMAQYNF